MEGHVSRGPEQRAGKLVSASYKMGSHVRVLKIYELRKRHLNYSSFQRQQIEVLQ